MLDSLLDQIEGLGESRRKSLLDKFGSVSALKSAQVSEIAAVPGIGSKLAKTIFDNLNQQVNNEKIDMQTGEILDA
jgi:excinuclease ABC subunit C